MTTSSNLYQEHLNRLKAVVAMEQTDRPPIMFNAAAFCIKYAGGKLADLFLNVEYGNELVLKGMQAIGDIDSVLVAAEYPLTLGIGFMSDVKVPGRELPEDMLWQIDERGLMAVEDYDTIISKGWNYFAADFYKNNLTDMLSEVNYYVEHSKTKIENNFIASGVVPLTPVMTGPPFETLAGARSMGKFLVDIHRMPDKVQAVLDIMQEETIAGLRSQIRAEKPFAAFLGAARSSGDFLSKKNFERFLWPYFKKLVDVIVEEGSFALLHLDSNWDRFLDYFLELPKRKCIFSPDSMTDIFKAKETLGNHMCITGDVPPTLLVLGTPDEVYNYSMKLIKEISPTGLIMSSGCSIPYNAKPENVKAMVAAAIGK